MSISDFLPRHLKGYLWITFLVCVFLLKALSENGAFRKESPKSYFISMPEAYAELPPSDWTVASISKSEERPKQSAVPAQGGYLEKILAESNSPVEEEESRDGSQTVLDWWTRSERCCHCGQDRGLVNMEEDANAHVHNPRKPKPHTKCAILLRLTRPY